MPSRNIKRAEAEGKGWRFYLGSPCRYGHSGLRYTSNYQCVQCVRRTAIPRPPSKAAQRAALIEKLINMKIPPLKFSLKRAHITSVQYFRDYRWMKKRLAAHGQDRVFAENALLLKWNDRSSHD